jgi:hypothetical protein
MQVLRFIARSSAVLALFAGCDAPDGAPADPAPPAAAADELVGIDDEFAAAAAEFAVPVELLQAIAYVYVGRRRGDQRRHEGICDQAGPA